MTRRFDDETLMAFIDGELDDATATAVERARGDDPMVAQKLAAFAESRALAKAAFDRVLRQPVPNDLETTVRAMLDETPADTATDARAAAVEPPPKVVDLARRDAPPRAANTNWRAAAAASVALIIGAAGGYSLSGSAPETSQGGLQLMGLPRPAVEQALRTVAAGREAQLDGSDDRFRAIASYRDDTGRLCREFEIHATERPTYVSVACHDAGAWVLTFTVAGAGPSADEYAPASSLQALDAYLNAVGAQDALSVEDEAEALKAID